MGKTTCTHGQLFLSQSQIARLNVRHSILRTMESGRITMRSAMKVLLLAAILLTAVSATEAQVSIGITIGPPPPVRVVRVLPARPDPEFVWVEGVFPPPI